MRKVVNENPPRTMMEVFKSLPEGTLAELIDNQLYMSPAPSTSHQTVSKNVLRKLMEVIEDSGQGLVFNAPLDVYLDEHRNVVQPDLIVVLRENLGIVDEKHIHGVPDMLIEILSPGNKDHDLIRKKHLYQQFCVREYWIIDPDNKLAVGHELRENRYHLISEDVGVIHSRLLPVPITF